MKDGQFAIYKGKEYSAWKNNQEKIIPHSINRRMGDHFCSLLGSTIICVPRFLRICSLSWICRQHRRDSGSNTSKPVCSLSVRMLYSHTARFLFYSVAAVDSTPLHSE